MSQVQQKLQAAVDALNLANKLQQEAFLLYKGALPDGEDPCYAIHHGIEDLIMQVEEVMDAVTVTA